MADTKRIDWVREKIEHGLGVDGSLFDELNERQGGTITSYLDGGKQNCSLWRHGKLCPHFQSGAGHYHGGGNKGNTKVEEGPYNSAAAGQGPVCVHKPRRALL
eukprot:1158274-Pelagomonas_calceolata.AAC.7